MTGELLTQEDSKRIKEFQALYYELNAKPDTTTKIFPDKVVVSLDDLCNLQEMVSEKLSLHRSEGKFGKTNVTVTTSKRKVHSFDDWTLFATHNWRIPEYIESVTLVWDFYIMVDGYENPQRHKLTVKISSGMKPEEVLSLLLSGKVEDIEDIEMQQAPIIAQMDFIENRLGQEFINIVTEWVGTLKKASHEKSKLMLKLKKHKKLVGYYFNYMLFLVVCFTLLAGFSVLTNSFGINNLSEISINNMNIMVNYTVIGFLICCIILNRGESTANKVYRKLSEYGEIFVFRITAGDELQYNSIKHVEGQKVFSVLVNLILSLIFNIGCGIIASIIYANL